MRPKRKSDISNMLNQLDTFNELLKERRLEEAIELRYKMEQYILNEVLESTGKKVQIPRDEKESAVDMFWYWLEEL